jgi:hypothetical protein
MGEEIEVDLQPTARRHIFTLERTCNELDCVLVRTAPELKLGVVRKASRRADIEEWSDSRR